MDHPIVSKIESYAGKPLDIRENTPLCEPGEHTIYWLGITDVTAFRCNTYLIADGDEYLIVDPGSRRFFPQVRDRVGRIVDPSRVTGMVICHQDPDVAASMVDWLEICPDATVFTTARTNVLLPHYGKSDYRFHDVSTNPC
jgi:flavorubredoxin